MMMDIDLALTTAQSTGSSLLQATLIIGMLAFLIWNVKLTLEDIE